MSPRYDPDEKFQRLENQVHILSRELENMKRTNKQLEVEKAAAASLFEQQKQANEQTIIKLRGRFDSRHGISFLCHSLKGLNICSPSLNTISNVFPYQHK
jgi:hypothetical protein